MGIVIRRGGQVALVAFALVLVALVLSFESITRHWVAVDAACSYCHIDQEYRSDVRMALSKPHPPLKDEASPKQETSQQAPQTACAGCHVPPGFINGLYVYSHFASLTDLFGHLRSRMEERSGVWLPPRQAAAYRVRDRLFAANSPTCRSCHIEEEIEPTRKRGQNAHKKALDERMTCIECHYNEKHLSVDLRDDAFANVSGS